MRGDKACPKIYSNKNLGCPLLWNVVKRIRRVNTEAHKNNIGVWITERSKAVIVFLASCIP